MGSGGSKAAARSYAAAEQAAARSAGSGPAAAELVTGSAVAADAAKAAQQARRQNLTLEQAEALEARDQGLGSLLDRLGGAIQGKAVAIMPTQAQLASQTRGVLPDSSGRLPPDALKELLELHRAAAGGPLPPQAEQLLRRHRVDPQLVQAVLSRACAPDVVEAAGPEGVRAFAEWPPWFQRRRQG